MSEIKSWYAGKNILLTGSTGFIGKVLLEKILRVLGDINTIYLILRPKKNENFEERCKSMFNNVVSEKKNQTSAEVKVVQTVNIIYS